MKNTSVIEQIINPKVHDLGAFQVRRSLPAPQHQRVGPFIFFDQFGPTILKNGEAVDVRPHPHIGLSTLTWMFAGEIQHKDSLGNDVTIKPGEVNWMTAGSGIVHSERSPLSQRDNNAALGGTQVWLALPIEKEEIAPAFYHYPASSIPTLQEPGITLTLIAGAAYGLRSPVHTESDTFFADLRLAKDQQLRFPTEIEECAFYVITGTLEVAGTPCSTGTMIVLKAGAVCTLKAQEDCHCILLGGARLSGERHLYWNFVSSRKERIEQAKTDWREGRFAKVAGDDEFIPLPEAQH